MWAHKMWKILAAKIGRSKPALRQAPVRFGVAGLVSCLAGISLYAVHGFTSFIWLFWAFGCSAMTYCAFWLTRRAENTVGKPAKATHGFVRRDWLVALGVLLVFAPVYTYHAHDFPRQMNTDEIAIMSTAKTLAANPHVDIFGISHYSDLPSFIFWLLGKLAVMLGGVNLANMRFLHAASGVLIIAMCYILLRLLSLPRYAALAGTVVIGLNHSLFFLSRMAMRDNTALLFELIALSLLLYGWQRRSYGWTLLGGFAAGLTFYTYYPSRITIVIWVAFVLSVTLLGRFKDWKMAGKLLAVTLLGMVIIVTPLFIANHKHVSTDPYPDQQFLWQKAAREQEKSYRYVTTESEAIRINIHNGLLAFNQPYADQGSIYNHPGFGFVDTKTGALIWAGLAVIVVSSVFRRRLLEQDILGVTGFMVIWLSMAFLLTRAPDYTRMLIVLPFVAYLIGRLVEGGGNLIRPLPVHAVLKKLWPWTVALAVVLSVGTANLQIIQDFRRMGEETGDGVGDTLRYQERHVNDYAKWVFVPPTASDGYFYWGIEDYWHFWLDFGKGSTQGLAIVDKQELLTNAEANLDSGQKGYLLTTGTIWATVQGDFSSRWRVSQVERLDRAGNRVVVTYDSL